jgi:HAD superfamily hydrolase (TIGR01509 family)
MKNGKFAAIFDMDGVLVDTYDIMWGTHKKELEKYGVCLTDKDIALYVGGSLKDNVHSWNDRYGLSLDFDQYSKYIWAIQAELFKTIDVQPNLVHLLQELSINNVPKGVGTCAHKKRAEDILKNTSLEKYFPILVTSDNVTKHKPHPDIYLEVARMLGVQPQNCVVFEDAKAGIQAAKAGNMKAIGYLNKHNNLEELSQADTIINNFSEINYDKLNYIFAA